MKRIFITILLTVLCYYCIAQTTTTTIQRDGYTLIATVTKTDPNECSIKIGTSPTSDAYLDIPSVVVINDKEYTVTSIESSAFSNIENFKGDLILPSSIAYINGAAFQNCSGFSGHLILPAYCKIYKDAFSGCEGFTTVTLSPGVEIEHTNAFGNNSDNIFPNVTTVYLLTKENLPNKISKWINSLGNKVIRPEDQLAPPTITPDGDLYTNAITDGVIINGNTNGATIYYTIDDGINWLTTTSGTPLKKDGNTLSINEPTTIKFYTKKDGKQSPTIVAEYTFKAVEPVLTTKAELPFEGKIEVSITCETDNATIYYTIDGSTPTTSSPVYNGPITISETTTVKAFASNNINYNNWIDSDEVTAIYTKKGTALAPVFTPAPGTYSYNSEEDLTVTINCNNEGSTAYHYTTDGSTPTTSCSVYNGPITVSKNTTIKAIACCADLANSAVSTATYTITKTVAKPTFDTIPGNYNDEQTVSIKCKTEGVTIYYTTDGSTPTTSSSVYNNPITIEPNERTIINAIAVKNGTDTEFEWLDSELASGTYNDNTMVIFIKDGNWSNPNNWSSGFVPNKDGRAAIGANLTIANGETAEIAYITNVPSTYYTAGTITIADGGQLIADEAAIENVNVKKEIAGHGGTNGGWYAISTPIANEINNTYYNNLISSTAENYDLYYYNESKWYWYNFKDTDNNNNFKHFNLGQGYLYANSSDNTIVSVGVPRMKNTVSVSVSKTNYTPSNNNVIPNFDIKGFNLIGNPFTFDIRWGEAIKPGDILVDGYYTLGTDGSWNAKTTGTVEPIKVGMGIMVQANKSGTVDIQDIPYRQTKQSQQRRMSVKESLSITIANEKYTDVAYINFSNYNENGLRKIAHMNEDIQMVYVPVKGVNYAIANVDDNASEVPVSFETYVMGKYTISIEANNIQDEVYLLDKITGEKIDILNEDYTFVATSSDKAERFSLLFVNNDDDDSDNINPTFAYINNGDIIISDIEGSGNVKIYDMMGRLVIARNAYDNARITTESLTSGLYIINLIDGDGIKTQKIAIRK